MEHGSSLPTLGRGPDADRLFLDRRTGDPVSPSPTLKMEGVEGSTGVRNPFTNSPKPSSPFLFLRVLLLLRSDLNK